MKKASFAILFVLVTTVVFSQNLQVFKAGEWQIMAVYEDNNTANTVYNRIYGQGTVTSSKASKEFEEYIRQAVNSFATRRGDVFSITISNLRDLLDGYLYYAIVEFTSDTDWHYWFFQFQQQF